MTNPEKYTSLFLEVAVRNLRLLEGFPAHADSAQSAISACKEARLAAHSLKGDALMMGSTEIAETAAALEDLLLAELA